MSVQDLNEYVNVNKGRKFLDESLRTMTKAELNSIIAFNGKATVGVTEDMRRRIEEAGGVTSEDKRAAIAMLRSSAIERTAFSQPDEFLVQKGGQYLSTPTAIVHYPLIGEKIEKKNTPIPIPFKEQESRQNVDLVAVIAAQSVLPQDGIWVTNTICSLSKGIEDVSVDHGALIRIGDYVSKALSKDKVWKAKTEIERSAVTGINHLIFMREFLNRTDRPWYDFLNTMITLDLMKIGQRGPGGWMLRPEMLPHMDYMKREPGSNYSAFTGHYPQICYYKGGSPIVMKIAQGDGTMEGALKAQQVVREGLGGDKSPAVVMALMKGSTGYTTEMGKRVQFLIGSSIASWKRGKEVDINLQNIGDLPVLHSSLSYWAKKVCPDMKEPFMFVYTGKRAQITAEFRSVLQSTYREGSIAILFSDESIPTGTVKGQAVDYDAASAFVLPEEMKNRDIIAHVPIFGHYFFKGDEIADERIKARATPVEKASRKYYVGAYASALSFRGVVTTLQDLKIFGFGHAKEAGKWQTQKEMAIVPIELQMGLTYKEWMNRVVSDCNQVYLGMFKSIQRYSPLSNLVYSSKKVVQLQHQTLIAEGDQFATYELSQRATMAFDGIKMTDEFAAMPDYDEMPDDPIPEKKVEAGMVGEDD